MTISGGLVMATRGEGFEQLVQRADAALYRAKQAGRNRIECEGLSDADPAPAVMG